MRILSRTKCGVVALAVAMASGPVHANEMLDLANKRISEINISIATLTDLKGSVSAEAQKAIDVKLAAYQSELEKMGKVRELVGGATPAIVGAAVAPAAAPPPPSPVPQAPPAQTLVFAADAPTPPLVGRNTPTDSAVAPKGAMRVAGVDDPNPRPDSGNGGVKKNYGGLNFGVGLAFTYDLGKNDRVSDAEVIDGIIRVKKSANVRGRLILESHYLITPGGRFLGRYNDYDWLCGTNGNCERNENAQKEWGFGPFIAFQPGKDEVIEAIGGGLMLGLRRSRQSHDSFNLGIGVLYDLNSKTLGDGLRPNQPLPAGDTLRYREQEQSGLVILSSYSF